MTFFECCIAVMKAAREAKPGATIRYAHGYASAGAGMTDPYEIRVQALYILNNITTWRGDKARAVRAALKGFGGVKA